MSKSEPLVIIPSYQQPELLRGCVNSVLSSLQARIAILDDSRDNSILNSMEAIRQIRKGSMVDYIEPMEEQERINHISSWNRYQELVRGKQGKHLSYINLRHHDDHLLPRDSQDITDDFADPCAAALVIHPIMVPSLRIGKLRLLRYHCPPPLQRLLLQHLPLRLLLLFNYIGPTACVWIRQDLALNAPLFDEQLRWLVDVAWYYGLVRVCRRSEIRVSAKALNQSVSNPKSITAKLNPQITAIEHQERLWIAKTVPLPAWLFAMAALLRPLNRGLSWLWLKPQWHHGA